MKKILTILISITILTSIAKVQASNPGLLWNINNWIHISVTDDHGNEVIIVDQNNNEVPLEIGSYKVKGVIKYEDPPI